MDANHSKKKVSDPLKLHSTPVRFGMTTDVHLYRPEPEYRPKYTLSYGKSPITSLQARFHIIAKHQEWAVRREFIKKFETFARTYTD